MKYGYARVSTDGQSVDAQVRQLTRAGCKKVLREVASGAKTDRRQLRRALDQLAAGDVLIVTRLDRLARSTRDLLNTVAAITDKGAGFRSLGDAWADTTTAHGRLMLTVLGGLAEFECELIRARIAEGRARAKANGVRLGRKPKLTPYQRREAIKRRDETVRKVGGLSPRGATCRIRKTGETGCSGESLWSCPAQLVPSRCMRFTSAATPRPGARRRRWDCRLPRPSRSWPDCSVILFRRKRRSTARSGAAALDVVNSGH
jgi:DNA invertase Pin-like site-specific DNA recombinase